MASPTSSDRPVALITGASRGIGAATALALAARGYDVVITYRNKAGRAEAVRQAAEQHGARALALECDLTRRGDIENLVSRIQACAEHIDVLVLNASGGLERALVAADPAYPWRINHDAQLALVDASLPLLQPGGAVVFVTSHWAHLYGQVEQLPSYEAVAESKWAGEQALRSRQSDLERRGIRLLVVTGDLVEGTITPKLLERATPGVAAERRDILGALPSTDSMGQAIAEAATNPLLLSGSTVVVGGPLSSLPKES